MIVAMQKLTEQMQTMQEEMQQMKVSLLAKDEEIARLSITSMPVQAEAEYVDRSSKVADQFAQSLKTDSQISSMNDVTHVTYPVLFSNAVPAQASVMPTRRVAPSLVTTVEKDLRAYLTSDGRHDPNWPEFVTNFINMFVYKKCYMNGKISTLPDFTVKSLKELKKW
jgi:predicted transcriptional regulator